MPSRTTIAPFEGDVLRAQPQSFEQSHPGAVEQRDEEPHGAVELVEQRLDLAGRQHDRQSTRHASLDDLVQPRQRLAEHFLVEEQQRGLGLVLRRGGDLSIDGEVRQERLDVGRTQFPRMASTMKADEALHPVDVDLLRPQGVVFDADAGANLVEQTGGGWRVFGAEGRIDHPQEFRRPDALFATCEWSENGKLKMADDCLEHIVLLVG